MAVSWGRRRMDLSGITAIGVDEIHWSKKMGFMTLVYQIDNHCKRLLWCGEKRTEKTISTFFNWFGEDRSLQLKFVCSDMWKPYLKLIAGRATNALNILDRFHVSQKLNKAIDEVRALETKALIKKGLDADIAADDAKTDGMAIAGFITGLVSLFLFGIILGPLGIIFSAIALKRIKRNPEKRKGRGLAIAGLILGICGVIGWAIYVRFVLGA